MAELRLVFSRTSVKRSKQSSAKSSECISALPESLNVEAVAAELERLHRLRPIAFAMVARLVSGHLKTAEQLERRRTNAATSRERKGLNVAQGALRHCWPDHPRRDRDAALTADAFTVTGSRGTAGKLSAGHRRTGTNARTAAARAALLARMG